MAFKFSNLSLPMGSGGNHLDPDTAIIDDLLDDHPGDRPEDRDSPSHAASNAASNPFSSWPRMDDGPQTLTSAAAEGRLADSLQDDSAGDRETGVYDPHREAAAA